MFALLSTFLTCSETPFTYGKVAKGFGRVSVFGLLFYKVKCRSCDFTYIGETKRSWNSRGGEHKPGTNNNKESAVKDHAETTDHDIDTGYMEILEKNVNNWHKRIFLESWHSTIDKNAVNERKPFPSVYKTLLKP